MKPGLVKVTAGQGAGAAEPAAEKRRPLEPAAEPRRPLIAEVKRNALDDGPGIRTTIFFKGCPLRCVWCHNPETKDPGPEIMRVEAECLRCGACVRVCPTGAMREGAPPTRDPFLCRACGRCVDVCPGRGARLVGAYHDPEELADLAALDLPFHRNSGGGVTLSGGEPTLYPRFTERLLLALRARGANVLLETCGYFAWPVFARRILPHLDAVYFDLKLADPAAHARYTGRDNRLVLDNLRRLVTRSVSGGGTPSGASRLPAPTLTGVPRLLVRVPLVPGITATHENLAAIARLLADLGLAEVALLPYNPLWLTKADGLGQTKAYAHDRWMTPEEERQCAETFTGFRVVR